MIVTWMTMTRTVRSIFALTSALCVAGLGVGPSAVVRRVNRTATVVGATKFCELGQEPPNCNVQSGCCGEEVVAKSHGHRVASQMLRHGRFRLHLVPGRYTIELEYPNGLRAGPSKKIRARAHRKTVANFYYFAR